jgi:glycosyltransferase involved in cell wall biosynthesis
MHVLQVTPRYFPNIGGVEVVVQKISEMLVKNNIDVTVYSVDLDHNFNSEQNINGVIVKRFSPLLGDPFFLPEPRFIRSLRREGADIIHVHNIHTLPTFLAALARKKEQKLLLQPHYHRFGQSMLRHSLFGLYKCVLRSLVIPSADLAIANSAYEERALHEDFPGLKNVALIPEGMDTKEVKHVKHGPVMPNRILYVGSLRRYKNVDKILEGFALFSRQRNDGSRLIIVGEGPEYEFLVKHAHSLRLDPFIEWKHGLSREQLLDEYSKASVFILLSRLESFSRAVCDALLIGVPVVVLNFGPLEDLVNKGLVEGVNSLDPKEIADAMINATGKTYAKVSDSMNAFLSWKKYSSRIIDVYGKLLKM